MKVLIASALFAVFFGDIAPRRIAALPVSPHASRAWMTTPWSGDSRPYEAIEAALKQAKAEGQDMKRLTQDYKAAARSRPADPVAQFRWAYAAALSNNLDGVQEALEYADPCNAYEYTRLRFLYTETTQPNIPHPELEVVGLRLLKHNPRDERVRANLIYALSTSRETAPKAVAYAVDWVKLEPANPRTHAVLADVCLTAWDWTKRRDKAYGDRALAEYQEYLRLAPQSDGYREPAKHLITYIQRMEAKQH